jgi:uncharacterized protein with ParB-like and HNH nuclease domain
MLEQIENNEIVLPSIQRNFVWDKNKIERLFDSLMRGYPIGISLLWETYEDIQYRLFFKDYVPNAKNFFRTNDNEKKLKLVLDGQQRLYSLLLGIYGTYEGKILCFDVLSGRENEDFEEEKYYFEFLSTEELKEFNEDTIDFIKEIEEEDHFSINEDDTEISYYVKVQDLISMGAKDKQILKQEIIKELKLSGEDILRLELNLDTLKHNLTNDDTILKVTVIDENKPRGSRERKSESDVLEAFIRINKEGTPLSRSDLIFSMLKLSWKDSAETLPDYVSSINEGNSFELDQDFVIRCLFAVSDLGTKFDINKLRKASNISTIENNFQKCCDSISSLIDFVQNECWISSSKLLGGYYNLVPFVYYLFNISDHQIPNSEIDRVRKAVYLFGFTSPFSRYADSRLNKFINEELKPLAENCDHKFPLEESLYWVWYWEKFENCDAKLLQGNPSLALHLVQHRTGTKVHYDKNSPQIDHIFPRSELKDKGYEEADINKFANLWILPKSKNQNKSKIHPKKYFEDVPDFELDRSYIDRKLLDYRSYKTFLKTREENILLHVKKELNISDTDFDVSYHWDID